MLTPEQIAAVCHDANRRYCIALGDTTQPVWEEAPEWQRQSAINGVQFHIDNRFAHGIDSHENWMREKLANGWKYGPVKDPERKEHPCLMPYHELPLDQRIKDSIFVGVVRAILGVKD